MKSAGVDRPQFEGKEWRFCGKSKARFWAKKQQLPFILVIDDPTPSMRSILFQLHNDLTLKDHLNKNGKLWLAKGGNTLTISMSVPGCLAKKAVWGIRLNGSFHMAAVERTGSILSGDHIRMCISIPPKYAVSEMTGYLEGKSAIAVTRQFAGCQKKL